MSIYIRPLATAPLVSDFITATSAMTFISPAVITGPRRLKRISNARKVVYFLARKHGYSFPQIATRLKLRDHGSVIVGRKAAIEIMARDPAFAVLVDEVEKRAVKLSGERRASVAAAVPAELRIAA